MAVATNFSRQIDEAAIKRSAPTSDKAAAVADLMLQRYFLASGERVLTPWREVSNAWQGIASRRESTLKKWLSNLGFTESTTPVSAPLVPSYVDEIASLTLYEFANRFGIAIPTTPSILASYEK